VSRSPKHFADMVAYADKMVGNIMAALEKHGLRDRTLVLFTGDNGTSPSITSQMGGRSVKGGKGSTKDNGMHVPLFANWPGVIPAGRVSQDLVDSTDFLPTICDAAGVSVPKDPPLDGHSFWPQLRGEKGEPRPWSYCWYARNGGATADKEFAMNQRFKLYRTGEFFNLTADLEEKQPLDRASRIGEAAEAHTLLLNALDRFTNSRPSKLK
jgi:arylsulfatase A